MSASQIVLRRVIDAGGGSFRVGNIRQEGNGAPRMVSSPEVMRLKFNNAKEIAGLASRALTEGLAPDQRHVVFSLAGPIDDGGTRLLKLTNHKGIDETDIPLSEMIEANFRAATGREINLLLMNDGEAGAWAEFSADGALGHLKSAELGMALIIGNGVGGRLYKNSVLGIESVYGGFEPGHSTVSFSLLRKLKMLDLVPDEKECGCGILGSREKKLEFCLESLSNGPTLQGTLRAFLEKMNATSSCDLTMEMRMDMFPRLAFTGEEIRANELMRVIFSRLGLKLEGKFLRQIIEVVAKEAINKDIGDAMKASNGKDVICRAILEREAALLASKMEIIQRGFDDAGSISFALIGGVGCGLGQFLVGPMDKYSAQLRHNKQVPQWSAVPKYLVGKYPADRTNLFGAYYYLRDVEDKIANMR